MARSTVSFGMFACRAASTAARSRGFAAGSGNPVRAAVVSSRMILVNTLARFLSCAPFRYMMFLNCEWPAIDLRAALRRHKGRKRYAKLANNPIWQYWGTWGDGKREFWFLLPRQPGKRLKAC